MDKIDFDIINMKLDLILANMPEKKKDRAPISAILPLKKKYLAAIKACFEPVKEKDANEQNFYTNEAIRKVLGQYLLMTIPEGHATWIGRLMVPMGFIQGQYRVEGRSMKGLYVTKKI